MAKGQAAWNRTPMDHRLIAEQYRQNIPIGQIAREQGVSTTTIYRRLNSIGVEIRDNSECHKGIQPWNRREAIVKAGYRFVRLAPDDPMFAMVKPSGFVQEHRLVMARHLGRCLLAREIVHHKNHDGLDNRIDNLELFPSHSYHMKLHLTSEEARRRGAISNRRSHLLAVNAASKP